MKTYKVNEDVVNAILKYLAARPYQEVAQLIAAVSKSEEVKDGNNEETQTA